MERQYGMNIEKKAGHWLCPKCHTWNREYSNATKKVVCPFCSAEKPDQETKMGGSPTKIDLDLYAFLKNATDEQKNTITKRIGTNKNIFLYINHALLKEKKEIMKFIEEELI